MDGPNKPCFQSAVILGLKTALLEAQDEINRLTKERDEAGKNALRLYQKKGEFELEVMKSNELATKLKTELKKVRKELEDLKMKLDDMREENERDHVNWTFKCNELKSLLDVKTELLESLNIKGDKANKDESINYRANYKMLTKNLKIVIKNRPCFSDNELIEDIRNIMDKIETGKPMILSKYLARKMKSIKNQSDKCCSNDEKNSVSIPDNSKDWNSTSASLSSCFTYDKSNCSENLDPNALQRDFTTNMEDICNPNSNTSTNLNLVREKSIEINLEYGTDLCVGGISLNRSIEKDVDTIPDSDSDSDSTSGFCDGETEVESPSNLDTISHSRSTPSPENHISAMCMPDLLLSGDAEKNAFESECSLKNSINDSNTNSDESNSVLIPKLGNDVRPPSPQKMKQNSKQQCEVQNILKEMEQMRNAMIDKISSLKQFDDDDLAEMNDCFKRPKSVPSSYRKPIQKSRKNVVNAADFIPKRSSQLVKRDPCCKKLKSSAIFSEICESSDTVSNQKIDLSPTNERNEQQKDSLDELNCAREALDLDVAKNLEVCVTPSLDYSSSLSNVTSCFEKPAESATESLTQLPIETDVRNTIDLGNTSSVINFSLSDTDVAVDEIEDTRLISLQNSNNDANYSTVVQRGQTSENLCINTSPSIESVANLCEPTKPYCVETPPGTLSTKDHIAAEKCIDNTSLEIDENLLEVPTKENDKSVRGFSEVTDLPNIEMSGEKLSSTERAMNQILVEQPLESSHEENEAANKDNFDSNDQKFPETTLNDDKSPFEAAQSKHVTFSDQLRIQSTSLKNDLAENVARCISRTVQNPVDESQAIGTSVTTSDTDVDCRSSVHLENTVDNDDPLKISHIVERCVNSSRSKRQTKVATLKTFISKKYARKKSSANFTKTEENVLKKIPTERSRSKKTPLNLQNGDEIPRTAGNIEEPKNFSTPKLTTNSANSESSNESCIPENDDVLTNSLIGCDSIEEKVSYKISKKRGRSKKSFSDLQNVDPLPKAVGGITEQPEDSSTSKPEKVRRKPGRPAKKSKAKTNIDDSENLNEPCVPKNSVQTNSHIDRDSAEDKVSKNISRKRGRPRKLSSKVRNKSVKDDALKSANSPTLRSMKRNAITKTSHDSPSSEKNAENNTITDPDSAEIKISGNATRKRRCGRSRKVSPVTESHSENISTSAELQCDDFKTTRSGRRWCTVDSREAKQIRKNVVSSTTMNNGMERRKRKGKYANILDSLNYKSKRRKSDHDVTDIESEQRRGCKRKTSLPIETFDSSTQTNWSPTESAVSENTNDKFEIETSSEAQPESAVSLVVTSPQNVENRSSPVGMKNSKLTTDVENFNSVPAYESCTNPANCSLSSSCQLVPKSKHNLLHQLIDDMSKIIREKVSSIVMDRSVVHEPENSSGVESKCDTMEASNCEGTFSIGGKNVSDNLSEITGQLEDVVPIAISLSTEAGSRMESVAESKKNECRLKLQNSSKSLDSDEEFVRMSVEKSSQKLVSNLPRSSSKAENDGKSVSNSSTQITKNEVRTLKESKRSCSLDRESETESITKTNLRASNPVKKKRADLTWKKQRDEMSIPISSVQTSNPAKDTSIRLSASRTENKRKSRSAKSTFDAETNKSPIKTPRRKASSRTPKIFAEFERIDSDDDSPVEIPSKLVISSSGTRGDSDKCRQTPETTLKKPFEEDASNSSSLSSHVSELDANVELVSQFENVRTPPKVKNLFDSSDEENSKIDAFGIIEEMASVTRCLLQRQKELAEFPPSPSPEKCPLYSRSRDEDDSEDETLIIAEDDQINDSAGDGIEVDKFNFHDMNDGYALPAYTKSLTPSGLDYGQLSKQVVHTSRTKLDDSLIEPRTEVKIENENQARTSFPNPVRFQFYKENVQLENDGGTSKALSPFDSVWETLKSLYVKSFPAAEDVLLIPCHQSVPHLAFFNTNRKPDSRRPYFCIEHDKITNVETLIGTYLKNVKENEYVAVKNFKHSVDANPVTISIALTNTVVKNSTSHMKKLKVLLGYLSNLCVDLETDHKEFLSIMQSSLKDRIFSKTWQVDENNDTNQVTCIIAMSVLFTMLSQRSNDVKSVKDLLLEGLSSWKYRGHPVAFGVLNACPTIFNDASRDCLLTQVILFTLINHSMKRNLELYKVPDVRDLIGEHYDVKLGDKAAEDYVKEAMLLFNDDTWVDAMVLLCKRKQFSWAYTNVIMKYLMQIINKWKECDFNEMILIKTIQALHKIVQSCPKTANNFYKPKETQKAVPTFPMFNIASIIKSLSDLLQCPKGSRELRETVAVALCNISHLNFDVCSKILLTWEPPGGVISNQTLDEMNDIMKRCRIMRPNVPNKWWKILLPKECVRKKYSNKQNLAARSLERANGDSSPQKQQHRRWSSNFHARNSVVRELTKKKKNKGKRNRNSREQRVKAKT